MTDDGYATERLDHLGIVAEVCREIGLAAWLDAQAPHSARQVSIGTATVAMVLNGLGFSNRQLYLVPQFFANKPLALLLGQGITAEQLNDDCLGRTLDWIAGHDPTRLFAGIAYQARRLCGIDRRFVHVDTTSFSVSGAYETDPAAAATIAITYGYSRDRRADLKQWMLALATTQDGDVPLFLQALDGNSADVRSLADAVATLRTQFAAREDKAASIFVADSGLYSARTMRALGDAGVAWISRVPETSTAAMAVIDLDAPDWRRTADGQRAWLARSMALPHGSERWLVVRTAQGETRARASMERRVITEQERWTKTLWHLSNQPFACAADAADALARAIAALPAWFSVTHTVSARTRHGRRGRPSNDAVGVTEWIVRPTLTLHPDRVTREVQRRACFIVGTNILDAATLTDDEVIATYSRQGSVERGFRFLKDPLFLASAVFVKKPERIVALSFIMVLCLLVYRLAEHRLRARLHDTHQTVPTQVGKPTAQPTMRWIFQLFEGIDVLTITGPPQPRQQMLGLRPVHQHVLTLLGPAYLALYQGHRLADTSPP